MRDRLEPGGVGEGGQQRRHPGEQLVVAGQRAHLAPELAVVLEGDVEGQGVLGEQDEPPLQPQAHGDPDVVEDEVARQPGQVGLADDGDRAGHADHAAEGRPPCGG